MSYVDGLMLTHRKERDLTHPDGTPLWTEPQWTAHWCVLIAIKNLESARTQAAAEKDQP